MHRTSGIMIEFIKLSGRKLCTRNKLNRNQRCVANLIPPFSSSSSRPTCFTASLQVRRGCKITVRIPCLVGFASAADQQQVEILLRHSVRSGLYPPQLTAEELIDSADDKLTFLVLQNGDHVFHELLPERVDISYNLRSRSHDRVIPEKNLKGHLTEKNIITRMLSM